MPEHDPSSADRGFAPGTLVFTARGEITVEALQQGDLLVTLSGRGAPLKPLLSCTGATGETVRLAAHALGAGIPARDLLLGAGQWLRVEGSLVPVRALLNGASIAPGPAMPLHRLVLAQPDLLIAEGAPIAALPDPPELAADPDRLAAIRAALAARGHAAADPRDAMLDQLIAGEAALSTRATLQAGAAPAALGAEPTDG